MGYSNSSLVKYTKLSPNNSGQRTHAIDTITPHCVVGQCTAEGLGDWFSKTSTNASSNYGIDKDGRVALYVEEKNRSWCTSNRDNDQRAITIECASDTKEPYTMNSKVYESLINLCADICKRNGKKKLIWISDKAKALAYNPKADEMLITVHRWFANKSCPGDWLYSRLGDLAQKVTEKLGSSATQQTAGFQATSFASMTEAEAVEKIGSLCAEDMKKSGILASISAAQFILECGYGKSELAQKSNNCFGMKCSLSGNTWAGSTWDGSSKYTKETGEQKPDGTSYTITADFRKYPDVSKSVADHSAYLLGAMNGSKKRYEGLEGEKDYKKAAQLIKDGGYATSTTYVEKLCSIVEKWNLTRFDGTAVAEKETETLYRVRKSWNDSKSQLGAYKVLSNAKKKADENPGYYVFDENGKSVYPEKKTARKVAYAQSRNDDIAGSYKVIANDGLNLRYEPGDLSKDNVITAIPNGAVVKCYGYYTNVGGSRWFYIAYREVTGFVHSSYLRRI